MNLLLINPAERKTLRANLPPAIERLRGKNPPIGLLYVAAAAQRETGWQTHLIDAQAAECSSVALARQIQEAKPDLAGITATTFTYLDALEAARIVKQSRPECPVVFGGVQPFIYPEETLMQPDIDMIIAGEAEESFPQMLAIWRDEGPSALNRQRLPGLAVKNGDLTSFAPAPLIENLDALPFPAWEISPISSYNSLVTHHRPVTIALSSRGCPYHCRYCALSPTGKRWRAHSPERVVEEMLKCRDLGINYILFYDEVFTVHRPRVLQICERIRRAGLRINWMARATPDTVNEELLSQMRGAGCDLITFGVEAGNLEVLQRLGRKPSIEETYNVFKTARRVGLRTIAYFMLGNPGETFAEMKQTLSLAVRLRPDMAHVSLYMPYPSSTFYQEALEKKELDRDYWRAFAQHPDPEFVPPYGNRNYTSEELEGFLLWFYRRFSFRLGFIWRRIMDLKGASEFRQAIRAAATLLFGFTKKEPV